MAILVTGLVTVHWGRLEFGNIGNYYIVEPFFRQLHRVFPDEEIITTFQMTDEFIQRERITVIPMETYYAWRPNELALAKQEYKIAQEYHHTKELSSSTPYIDVLRKCRLLVDISGDMWGDNANHIGENRFEVELLKLRTAQLLGVKTVLFAGSAGIFSNKDKLKASLYPANFRQNERPCRIAKGGVSFPHAHPNEWRILLSCQRNCSLSFSR